MSEGGASSGGAAAPGESHAQPEREGGASAEAGAVGEAAGASVRRSRGQRESARRAARRQDRWAHRRAEPRMLALVWTMYLLVATGLSFARVGLVEPVDVQVYRASARALLLSVAIGACVLWPMARLSQQAPRRPVWETFKDLLVIVAPMQAVIWGQTLLSGWPLASLGAVSLALAAWTAMCGGLLAMALGAGAGQVGPGRRLGAMVAILVVSLAGGLVVLSDGVSARSGLLTPYTVPWALLGRDFSLYALGPTRGQWGAVLGLMLAAGAGGVSRRVADQPQRQGANNGPLAKRAGKR